MKIRFRIVFEGVTEQESEWYREEGETEDPSETVTLARFLKWLSEHPVEFIEMHPGEVDVRVEVGNGSRTLAPINITRETDHGA